MLQKAFGVLSVYNFGNRKEQWVSVTCDSLKKCHLSSSPWKGTFPSIMSRCREPFTLLNKLSYSIDRRPQSGLVLLPAQPTTLFNLPPCKVIAYKSCGGELSLRNGLKSMTKKYTPHKNFSYDRSIFVCHHCIVAHTSNFFHCLHWVFLVPECHAQHAYLDRNREK